MEDAVYFMDCLAYLWAICYILWSFGIFFLFWYAVPRKILQPNPTNPIQSMYVVSIIRCKNIIH
jgi:hypothetical protein